MKSIQHLLLLLPVLFLAPPSFAQTWTETSAPTNASWFSIASSADGTRLIALFHNPVGGAYTSTNSGATWQTNIVISNPTHAASSADGTRLAVAAGNKIYISTNGGAIWFSNVVAQDVSGIVSSTDGMKLVAVNPSANGGHIFTSTDGGMTWATNTLANRNWTSVASSADGTRLIATANSGGAGAGIYTSTDSGLTWVTNALKVPAADWGCAASSTDGTKLTAGIGGNGGAIFTSTNSGSSWISNTMPRQVWISLACSADGGKLVGIAGDSIYTSTDGGTTWISNSVPKYQWQAVASSADGNSLEAVDNTLPNTGIYMLQTTPTPQMSVALANNNLNLSWIVPSTNFVLQSSADLSSWTDLTNQPVLNLTNLQDEVYLSPTGGNVFYRLSTTP